MKKVPKNYIFWSEIGSGFREPSRIPPPPPPKKFRGVLPGDHTPSTPFSRAWHSLCFPALGTGHVFPPLVQVMFSCTWHRSCFPALGTGHVFPRLAQVMFSRAWHRSCFPAFGTGHVFPRLVQVMFSRA